MAKKTLTKARPVEVLAESHGKDWSIYQADCVDLLAQMPENSIDISIYSPPFANLYIYSESECDMGNSSDTAEFLEGYSFTVKELHRVTRPGRVSCVHCKQLVRYKGRDGMAGQEDFRGAIIKLHVDAGWAYHSEVVIWKDPVIEMQRTKAHGLLFKQLRADSTFSRMGMAEYIMVFRKWADEKTEDQVEPVEHEMNRTDPKDIAYNDPNAGPVNWQKWASPVWMDIRQTNVLNTEGARAVGDEKHICPLQLDVIERCMILWSNPGDICFSPFMGIGSEGYQAIKFGRKFIGTELKESYFKTSEAFLKRMEAEAETLFQFNT